MSDNLVSITIDGHRLSVPKGTLVVEAARQIGIEIPVYCYHPKMKPVGACRVCAVEVENQRRPIMTACTTEVMPDMVVHTRSENAIAAREGILEFLLINHPLDCPVCDRGGECDLQDFTMRYGPPTTRFVEQKRHFAKSKQVGQNVILDRERCIMCQRCVRFCDEIAIEEGLVIIERGNRSEIGTFEDRSFDSQFSGNTIELCPVGALTAKTYRFQARPWEQQHFAGVCTHCSMGCNLTVDVRFDEVVRFRSRVNDLIDDGWLCDRGRYGYQHIHSQERVEAPKLRNASGALESVSWETALSKAAEKLKEAGAKASILLDPSLSLEDGHAFLRLGRSVLQTADVAHSTSGATMLVGEDKAPPSGQIYGCDTAEVIICLGSDPTTTHPVLDLRIKKGLRQGARLAVLGGDAFPHHADFRFEGTTSELWGRLVEALKEQPEAGVAKPFMPAPRPWEAGGASSRDWDEWLEAARGKSRVLVIVDDALPSTERRSIVEQVEAFGWSSSPHGVLELRTGANARGLDLLGCGTDFGPAVGPLKGFEKYQEHWGSVSTKKGEPLEKLLTNGGGVALWVGGDPIGERAAKKPDFLIVCSSLKNETTEKADLVLPLSTWLESHGTFVNLDGHLQFSRQAVLPVGESQPGWAIATRLAEKVGKEELPYRKPEDIFAEIGRINPSFLGRSYRDFQQQGEVHWSYPQQAGLGMPRPDLSAIPVARPDTAMWMPTVNTGSRVEQYSRFYRGETPPAAPGQRDPREVAALLGLSDGYREWEGGQAGQLAQSTEAHRSGYLPLRVLPASAAAPPGPTPSERYHDLGLGVRVRVPLPIGEAEALDTASIDDEKLLEEGGDE